LPWALLVSRSPDRRRADTALDATIQRRSWNCYQESPAKARWRLVPDHLISVSSPRTPTASASCNAGRIVEDAPIDTSRVAGDIPIRSGRPPPCRTSGAAPRLVDPRRRPEPSNLPPGLPASLRAARLRAGMRAGGSAGDRLGFAPSRGLHPCQERESFERAAAPGRRPCPSLPIRRGSRLFSFSQAAIRVRLMASSVCLQPGLTRGWWASPAAARPPTPGWCFVAGRGRG